MKKLYTLLLALLTVGTMSARELTFYNGNTPIAPGSTVAFPDYNTVDVGGGYFDIEMHPALYLGTDIFTNKIKITAVSADGKEFELCPTGATCKSGSNITFEGLTGRPGSPLEVGYKWNGYGVTVSEIPTITSTITAVDTSHPETEVSITVIMGPGASGISEITKDKSVRWTAQGLEYDIDGTASISVYSITGTQVLAVKASGHGTVGTHSLRPGIYIYTVQGDGLRQTGKIQVK